MRPWQSPELAAFAFPLHNALAFPGHVHQWPFLFIFLFTSSWSYPPLEVVVKFGCFCANFLAVWKKLSLESYVRGRKKEGSKGLSCFSHQYKSVERETMNIFIYYLYGAINVLGTLQSNKRRWPCHQNLAAWGMRAGLLQLNDQGWITGGQGLGVWDLQDSKNPQQLYPHTFIADA